MFRGPPAARLRRSLLLVLLSLAMSMPVVAGSGGGAHVYAPAPRGTDRSASGEVPAATASHVDPRIARPLAPQSGAVTAGERSFRPTAIIDPLAGYAREPAPMGVADFGVTGEGAGAQAYSYTSSAFEGTADVRSMDVAISYHGSTLTTMAFELNAMVVLQQGGTNYTYWIQNGLHLDAASDEFTIGGAYVWNFSSPTARLSSGELEGNSSSSLATDTYYFIPGCGGFAGQCSTLSLPVVLTGRILSSTSNGTPYVAYQYDLGSGWVTYDNVSFRHMTGARDLGFLVDGFTPTPLASTAFYDAEWDWVAAGGGLSAVDHRSNLSMALDYWNGHNYQAVPGAWNFGGDTGETSSNVSAVYPDAAGSSFLGDELTSGSGSLGVLYNRSDIGFLNLSIPSSAPQTILVDGAPILVTDGWTNLTLPEGTHEVLLENYSNASMAVSISAGSTSFVNLSGAGRITFAETGLPTGTSWGVSINGSVSTTTARTIDRNLPNGTYAIAYVGVPGYARNGSDPRTLTVPPVAEIVLAFRPFAYIVPFEESGLPAGTSWWVNASGLLVRGTGSTLNESLPNGTASYTAGASYLYLPDPADGSVEVYGGVAAPVSLSFVVRPGYIVGTVAPTDAEVLVGGAEIALTQGSFNDSVAPGTYAVAVSAHGYVSQSRSVTVTAGNVSSVAFDLAMNSSGPSGGSNSGTSSGGAPGPSTLDVELAAGVAIVLVVAVVIALVLRRRT